MKRFIENSYHDPRPGHTSAQENALRFAPTTLQAFSFFAEDDKIDEEITYPIGNFQPST